MTVWLLSIFCGFLSCSLVHLHGFFSFWQVIVTQLQQMKVNILVKEITDIGAFGIMVLAMTTK